MGLNEASRAREHQRAQATRRLKVAVLLVGVIGVVLLGYLWVSAPTKEDYLARGIEHVEEGQTADAIVDYLNALRLDETYAEARYRLAQAYLKRGQLADAMTQYIRTADLQPTNIDAQLQSIKLLLAARRFDDASRRAAIVIKNEPTNVDAHIARAMATARLVDLDNGRFEFVNPLAIAPPDPRDHLLFDAIEGGQENLEEAAAAFRKAVEVAPRSVTALHALAAFYLRTRRLEEAEGLLRQAIAIDPSLPESHRRLALLLVATRRAAEAEAPLRALAESTRTVPAELALADYYFNQRRDDAAIRILDRTARTPAGFVAAGIRRARILYVQKKPDEAHAALADVLRQEPKNVDALMLRAQFELAENNASVALTTAQEAAAAAPESAIARTLVGDVLSYRSQYDEAINAFNEALRLNPVLEPAKLSLLHLELQRNNMRRAEELANEALRENSLSVPVRLARAQVWARTGDFDLAIAGLNTVLLSDPDHALALSRLGEIHLRRRDFTAARQAFDKAVTADPQLFEALRGRVNLAVLERRTADAYAMVDARLAQAPEDVNTLMLSARISAAQGNFDRQEAALRKVIAVQPGNLSALAVLANLYVDLNMLDSARARYEELSNGPMAIGAQTMLGLIYQTQNKPREARAVFEKLLAANPDTHVAANNLAWIHSSEPGGNLDTALQLAENAVRLQPGSPDYRDTLGWVYLKKDLTSQAIASFETAVKARPDSPEFHYHLGLAYRKAARPQQAVEALQRALTLKPDLREAQLALEAARADVKKGGKS
jgi:tetratricopeptide (TPR) repeat protein